MRGIITTRRIVVAVVLDLVLITLSVVAVVADPGPLRFVGWTFSIMGVLSGFGLVLAWLRRGSDRASGRGAVRS